MALQAYDLEWRYSGGAGNINPELSVGGAMGGRIDPAIATGGTDIAGVTIFKVCGVRGDNYDVNNVPQQLVYTFSGTTLAWKNIVTGVVGAAVDVSAGGRFVLEADSFTTGGMIVVVDVNESILPTVDTTSDVVITVNDENLWDDTQSSELSIGATDYRCIYIYNPSLLDTAIGVQVLSGANPPYEPRSGFPDFAALATEISLDLDTTAGVGDGITTGVAQGPLLSLGGIPAMLDPQTQIPGFGLTFSHAVNATRVAFNLASLEAQPIWLRRVISPQTAALYEDVYSIIRVQTLAPAL